MTNAVRKHSTTTQEHAVNDHADPDRMLLDRAHKQLEQLYEEAQRVKLWGTISIQLVFEAGQVRGLYRRLEGREKI